MTLSIVVLNYKTQELTIQTIQSIYQHYKEEFIQNNFELIVVDNASHDHSVEAIKKFLSSIKNAYLVENDKNVGFAKGNNIGVAKARGEFLLFLNSDVELKDQGITKMLEYLAKNTDVVIAGGKLMDRNGRIENTAGNFFHLPEVFFMLIFGERYNIARWNSEKIQEADWVSGGLMMIRKKIFQNVKGFDENFFMYMEDMELCFRVKRYGKVVYFPHIEAIHKGQGSSNRSFAIVNIYKGLLYFYKKHKSIWEYGIVYFLLKTKALAAIGIGTVTNNTYLVRTYKQTL